MCGSLCGCRLFFSLLCGVRTTTTVVVRILLWCGYSLIEISDYLDKPFFKARTTNLPNTLAIEQTKCQIFRTSPKPKPLLVTTLNRLKKIIFKTEHRTSRTSCKIEHVSVWDYVAVVIHVILAPVKNISNISYNYVLPTT